MHQQPGGTPHHNLRFYIVMVTLVVAGIFFLLYMNDSNDFSLTSAIIGVGGNDTAESSTTAADTTATPGKNAKEVDVVLSFDQIPSVRKEARVQDLELRFDDLTTKINVNNDKLELNNLQQVVMRVEGFAGTMNFDRGGLSLAGTARKIEVNDIALSSSGEIKISFDNLNYKYLGLEDIDLKGLELPPGDGELKVAEKVQYSLQQDSLKMYSFNGKFIIDREAATLLNLEGVARGISISGALMNADLS
ncbi:hypothetical protein HYU22_03165 [Candidatus Woesearchaeota archaeon]|nr:hypothetical protein [Candidatus Woesearchaeota archaeon]